MHKSADIGQPPFLTPAPQHIGLFPHMQRWTAEKDRGDWSKLQNTEYKKTSADGCYVILALCNLKKKK